MLSHGLLVPVSKSLVKCFPHVPPIAVVFIPGGVPGRPSENMSRWVVGRTQEEAAAAAAAKHPGKKIILHQDEDVLDTW